MLEKIDGTPAIDKNDYPTRINELKLRVGTLQRQTRELGIPVVIVFEGWGAAGKGTLINDLILSMDPRGFNVHSTRPPVEEERLRPFLWRFWTRLPQRGRIAVFDRSWYGRVLADRVEGIVKKKALTGVYDEINAFERQIADDGAIIIKFFLHISKKEQKKRFNKLEKNPATSWKITKEDWRQHKRYDDWIEAIEAMLKKTGTDKAPWTIAAAHDHRSATVKVFDTVVTKLQAGIDGASRTKALRSIAPSPRSGKKSRGSALDALDLSPSLDRDEYEDTLKILQKRMWDIEHEIYRKRLPVAMVFEGWDASGKGGAIRRLAQSLDPRGYEVVPFAAPNDVEKQHQYLWRFWLRLPKAGHITIFDRSWYGRVLVERVEGLCKDEEWRRAYAEINETEAQWTNFGMVLIKFWLHISKEEQLRRFNERQRTPYKRWKITAEDWRNREKWDRYKEAVDEMILRTDTPHARWTLVEANSKRYARIKVLNTVIQAIEEAL
jgi:polyphosphate:AMP phosphotransferase